MATLQLNPHSFSINRPPPNPPDSRSGHVKPKSLLVRPELDNINYTQQYITSNPQTGDNKESEGISDLIQCLYEDQLIQS